MGLLVAKIVNKIIMAENYNAFKGLDLSDSRSENETREEYKKRQKQNRYILKLYSTYGREAFKEMFPEGITYEMFEQPNEEKIEKSNEKLGEVK